MLNSLVMVGVIMKVIPPARLLPGMGSEIGAIGGLIPNTQVP